MPEQKEEHKVYGPGSRKCFRCGNNKGLIRAYRLNVCRRCFREAATNLGFRKY